ncbi:hypothetical protein AHF37_10755 [Paragonimus kellicotti]|nr:hypothetical protein AHF37_10755 [Paragonimus kellicotti]
MHGDPIRSRAGCLIAIIIQQVIFLLGNCKVIRTKCFSTVWNYKYVLTSPF